MKKAIIILIVVLVSATAVAALFQTPVYQSGTVEDRQAVQAAVEKFYSILIEVGATKDVGKFSEILLDSPDRHLDERTRQSIEQGMGKAVAANAGYLTAMQSKYSTSFKVSSLLADALEKAQAENRELTQDEREQIRLANGGVPPPAIQKNSSTSTANSVMGDHYVIDFISIVVNGDTAIVKYDNQMALEIANLTRKNDRWFVTCVTPIYIHF